ncbi:cell division cycle protein [Histomonas meleagridis]|uniref:cell division cycle protein 48 n=1 Tax=Histomonas meleagridis TaxID=135588 RepID=UPI003559CF66|nr:cell division cycle protein [Histomonas meleagridis]KAH0798718.1 cell division cycle protein 48 [Histomonas meleagridis]
MSFEETNTLIIDRLPFPDAYQVYVNCYKMGELQIKNGTIIEIKSEDGETIYAPCFASEEQCPYGFIQMSRVLRVNLKCKLGNIVKIKAHRHCPIANCVVFSPIEDTIQNISGTYANILFNSSINLLNIPIKKNQVIPVQMANRVIEFKAVIVQPADISIIDQQEIIACRNTPVNRKDSPSFSGISYDDIGGLSQQILQLRQVIEIPLLHPNLFSTMDIPQIKSVLVTGPSGIGKTLLGSAIENELPLSFTRIECFTLYTMTTEKAISHLLRSIRNCIRNQPSVIFFDDIDIISSIDISKNGESDPRLSGSIISAIKRLRYEAGVVIIATSRDEKRLGNSLKPYFDFKIEINLPNEQDRFEIIRLFHRKIPFDDVSQINDVVEQTEGLNGAQIEMQLRKLLLNSISEVIQKHRKSESSYSIKEIQRISIEPLTISERSEKKKKKQKETIDLYPEFWDKYGKKIKPIITEKKLKIELNNYLYSEEKRKNNHKKEFTNPFEEEEPINAKAKFMPKRKETKNKEEKMEYSSSKQKEKTNNAESVKLRNPFAK